MGTAAQVADPLWRELVACVTACIDGVVVVGQVLPAQVYPKPFHRVQFPQIGRPRHEDAVVGHAQGMGAVPFGLVEHHDRLLVVGQLTAEIVEKQTYRLGQDDRHDKREASAVGWPHSAKQVNLCVPLIIQPWRRLVARPPTMANAALLADAGFVQNHKVIRLPERACVMRFTASARLPF